MVTIQLRSKKRKSGPSGRPWCEVADPSFRVRFNLALHGVFCVLGGVYMMAMGEVRGMRGLLVVAGFVVCSGFLVMTRSVLVVFRCLLVVMSCILRHVQPPEAGEPGPSAQSGLSEVPRAILVNAMRIADEYVSLRKGARRA